MCEPATITTLAVTAISTAVSMYSQNEQAKGQARAAQASADYNSQVAAGEAATKQQLAQNELQKGVVDRERLLRQAARQQGEMASGLAANGFTLDSGSPMDLLAESASEAQYDAQMVSKNAEHSAWQHMVGVNAANNAQNMYQYQSATAYDKTSNMLNMGSTLLGGIGKGIGQYNDWQKTQTPSQKPTVPTTGIWRPVANSNYFESYGSWKP